MIKQFFKKVLISYLIIICCIFTPTYRAYAASAGGWAFSAYDVATSVVTALKGGASASVAVAKSPITQKIGKGILGGVIAGAAIPLAISQLSGIALNAVDWVLDSANNQIKYKDKTQTGHQAGSSSIPNTQYYYQMTYEGNLTTNQFYTAEQSAAFAARLSDFYNGRTFVCSVASPGANMICKYNGDVWASIPSKYNPAYNPSLPSGSDTYKTVPISTVADKIYDNAKTDAASASVVNDAVKDYVNEGSADVALDAAKADADATHNCGTGTSWNGSACVADTPTTPTTPTTDTPFDPTSIIDAIGKVFDAVMSLPDVINNALDSLLNDIKDFFQPVIDSVTDFFDWVKTTYDEFVKPADNEPTELDIPNDVPTPTDTNISFGGMCPPNAEINVRIPFATINATLFDWSKWCYNLDTFVKPVIILLAAYFSVLIFRGKNESS